MNPTIDCQSRSVNAGEEVCVRDIYSLCAEFATVPDEYNTCSKIAQYLGISVTTLRGINPGLDCNDIQMSIYCKAGSPPYCENTYTITNETLADLLSLSNLTER